MPWREGRAAPSEASLVFIDGLSWAGRGIAMNELLQAEIFAGASGHQDNRILWGQGRGLEPRIQQVWGQIPETAGHAVSSSSEGLVPSWPGTWSRSLQSWVLRKVRFEMTLCPCQLVQASDVSGNVGWEDRCSRGQKVSHPCTSQAQSCLVPKIRQDHAVRVIRL